MHDEFEIALSQISNIS